MARGSIQSFAKQIVASAAVTTSSNSGNLKGTAFEIPTCDAVSLVLDVTNNAGAGGTGGLVFRVYIDNSPDGGTTWYPAWTFAGVTTSTDIQRAELRPIGIGVSEAASLIRIGTTIVTTTASTVSTVLVKDHRVRWEFAVSETGTTATFALWAFVQPYGTYGA